MVNVAFVPLLAVALAAIVAIAAMPPNADQAVGELGSPQIVKTADFFDKFQERDSPGPPAF